MVRTSQTSSEIDVCLHAVNTKRDNRLQVWNEPRPKLETVGLLAMEYPLEPTRLTPRC